MLEQFSAADFETLPDRRLDAVFDGLDTPLEITEVRLLPASAQRPTPPFALVLRHTGAHQTMPQGIYVYRHPLHGAVSLFTVPIGSDGTGMCYEITFN